jgi:hypothetical protein
VEFIKLDRICPGKFLQYASPLQPGIARVTWGVSIAVIAAKMMDFLKTRFIFFPFLLLIMMVHCKTKKFKLRLIENCFICRVFTCYF